MSELLLKGIVIGLIFGLPVGAVGAMTVRNTLQNGFSAGLLTGLGSSTADCLYALVGVLGITVISDFLVKYAGPISMIGGILIFAMGVSMFVKKPNVQAEDKDSRIKMYLSALSVSITNPAAVFTFLFAFSYFGIADISGIPQKIALVIGIVIGTFIWWATLSAVTVHVKAKSKELNLQKANRIFGVILILFAVTVFMKILV